MYHFLCRTLKISQQQPRKQTAMYIDQEATNQDMVDYFKNVLDATSEINKKQMMEMIRSVFLSAVSPSTLTDAYASMLTDRADTREINPPEAIPITPVINAPLYVSTQNIEFDTQFDISAKAPGALSQPGTFTYVHSPWKGWKEIVAFVEWGMSSAYTLTGAALTAGSGPTLCQQLPVGPAATYTDVTDSWLAPYGIPSLMIPASVNNPFTTANQVFTATTCGTQDGAPFGAGGCEVAQLYRIGLQAPAGYNFGPYTNWNKAPGQEVQTTWLPSNGFLWNPGQIKPYVPKSNSSTATYDRILIAGPPKYQLNPGFQLDQNYSMGRILSLFFSCSVTPNASGTTANGKVQMALISDAIQPSFTTAVLKQQGGKNYISTALTETVDSKSGTSIGGGTYCLGPNVLQKLIPLTDELEAGEGHGGLLTDVVDIQLLPHGTANSLLPITGMDAYSNEVQFNNEIGPSIGPVPCALATNSTGTVENFTPAVTIFGNDGNTAAYEVSAGPPAVQWEAVNMFIGSYGPVGYSQAATPTPAFPQAASATPYVFGSAALSVGACASVPINLPGGWAINFSSFPGVTGTEDANNLSVFGPRTHWTGASSYAALNGNQALSTELPLYRITGWNWATAYNAQGTADENQSQPFAKNMVTDNFGGAFSWMGCISHAVQPVGATYAKMKTIEESAILTGNYVSGLTPHMPFSGNSVTQTPIQSVMIPRPPEGLPPVFKFNWTIGPGATRACSLGQGFHLYMRAKHDGTFEQSTVPFAFGRWPGSATMSTYGNQQPRPQDIASLGFGAVSTIYTNLGNLPHPDFGSLLNGVGAEILSGGHFNQLSQTIRVPRVPTGAAQSERWSYMATYVGLHSMTDATCSCSISAQYPRYYDTGVIGPAFVTLVSGLTEGQQFSVQLQQIHQVIANAATSALGINAAQSYAQPPLVNMAFPRLIDALFSNGKSQFFRCVKTNAEFRRSVFKLYAAKDIFEFLADVVARDGAVNDPAQPEIRELAKIATAAAAIQNMGSASSTMAALEEMRDDIANALKKMRGETGSIVEETLNSGGWFSKIMDVGRQVANHAQQIAHVANQVSNVAQRVNTLNRAIHSGGPGMIGADGPGMIGARGCFAEGDMGMIGADGPGMIGAEGDFEADGPGMIGAEGDYEAEHDVSAGGIAYDVTNSTWKEIVGGSPNGLEGVTVVGAPFIPVRRIEEGKEMENKNEKTMIKVINEHHKMSLNTYDIKAGMTKLLTFLESVLSTQDFQKLDNARSISAVVAESKKIIGSMNVVQRSAAGGQELRTYVYTKSAATMARPNLEAMLKEVMDEPVRRQTRNSKGEINFVTRKYLSPMSDYKMLFLVTEDKNEKLITGNQWSKMIHLQRYGAPKTKSGLPSRQSVEYTLDEIAKRTNGKTFVLYYQIVVTAMLTWMALGNPAGMKKINDWKLKRMLSAATDTEYVGEFAVSEDSVDENKHIKSDRFKWMQQGGFRADPTTYRQSNKGQQQQAPQRPAALPQPRAEFPYPVYPANTEVELEPGTQWLSMRNGQKMMIPMEMDVNDLAALAKRFA